VSDAISAAIYSGISTLRDPQPQIEGRDPDRQSEDAHPTQGPHDTD